ncbi:ATP-binding cassette domain-containing protein [Fibrella aquatica]|uniref:ATP-binding cassette domain-containing protein n=1 Tax=Fibrella aquatica TaxID=3242487 RepID=UPI003522B36C
MLIQLVDATFRNPTNTTYPPINWTLEADQHWAIMGPSGSGKSLLLDALAGRITLLAGKLLHPVGPLKTTVELVARDYSFDWRIASAAQFYQQRYNTQTVDTAPTVRDVLQGQVRPTGTIDLASAPVPPPAYTDEWLADIAAQLNITYLLDRRLTSLSNGETRRTLLVRSLLERPRVLLLDNPFVGLDTDSRVQLHAIIDRVAQSGVALVMVVDERDVPDCVTNRLTLIGTLKSDESTIQLQPASTSPQPSFTHAVRMRNVTIRYGDKTVLHGINWTVRRGEKWALLGANGSGKSTLLSLITADNPQAYANDFDLFDRKRGTGESIWSIKAKIGFVSPELHLYFPRQIKVYDVVASGLFDTMGLFRKLTPEQRTRIEDQLRQLGLDQLRDQPLSALSVGQQRWVLLARALIKNPPLLVLDEPTQGLDATQTSQFRQLVEQICTVNPDQTLIYVTHYTDELPNSITNTLRLADGRIVV